jgi:uncharacterized Ntn-hydrolase superfamily protein
VTYSIVARDAVTGQMGVAVQSHYFSVGPVVPWLETGVGAVATQSIVEPAYGPRGLDLMRSGMTAPDALRALLTADPGAALRQVAMIDAVGNVAAHTGDRCIAHAGHRIGAAVSVQANMMERDTVPDAMLRAYDAESGDLAHRMLAALDAAEAEGGDLRGRQSAAIVVVNSTNTRRPWLDRPVDLRVEDHTEPLVELRRLLTLRRAYDAQGRGEELLTAGKIDEAMPHIRAARELAPDNVEIAFWLGLSLARTQPAEARALIAQAVRADPRWAELLRRLPAAGLFSRDAALLERLLAPGD